MIEIRTSKIADVPYLKEIWKSCFGDDDFYIDFFFLHQYKENRTIVLSYLGRIAAMLTMIPVSIQIPHELNVKATMIYAVATHPKFQGKGFSTSIMEYTKGYLQKLHIEVLTLVPATESLFDFYSKRGYTTAFYIKETVLTDECIMGLKKNNTRKLTITPSDTKHYILSRNHHLQGRMYVEYGNNEIDYQKKLSLLSGADIYVFDEDGNRGCTAIERINSDKVMIKEILMPDELLFEGLKKIAALLPAKEYIIRLPAYAGEGLFGSVRRYGMLLMLNKAYVSVPQMKLGYLGLAFD